MVLRIGEGRGGEGRGRERRGGEKRKIINEWMRYVCRTQCCGVGLKLRVLERKTGREMREGEGRGGEERGGEGRSRAQCVVVLVGGV